MKLDFLFFAVMLLNISCAQHDYDAHSNKNIRPKISKKSAKDAFHIINNKFDQNRITLDYLSDKIITASNIKKIIDLTGELLEKEIPRALSTVDRAEAQAGKFQAAREKILLIKEKLISAREKAVEKAEKQAKTASLKAMAEKDKSQKAQEELAKTIVDPKFVQTNMPKVSAAQTARDAALAELGKTRAYFHAVQNLWAQEALNESITKTKTYVDSAENSAKEADIYAKRAHEQYQNILQKNKNLAQQDTIFNAQSAALKASNDVEAAILAVQEVQIKTMLILRLYEHDLRSIYNISQAIEKSVRSINLALDSIKAAVCLDTAGDQQIALARSNLQKTSSAFELHTSSVSHSLFKTAKDKLECTQNTADLSRVKAAQKALDIVVDNLKISTKHLKAFGTSLAYNAMKSAYTNAKKFRPLARKAAQAAKN